MKNTAEITNAAHIFTMAQRLYLVPIPLSVAYQQLELLLAYEMGPDAQFLQACFDRIKQAHWELHWDACVRAREQEEEVCALFSFLLSLYIF